MSPDRRPDVSVVVCTRDRADLLSRSLETIIAAMRVTELDVELVVVDNGSTDRTESVLSDLRRGNPELSVVAEPTAGIARARNAGLSAARGRAVLFTDDDTEVPPDWITKMAAPLLSGAADAVAGGVVMAPELERDWMTPDLRSMYFADNPRPPAVNPGMAGANMGVTAEVAEEFRFDEALGTPAYPGSEDVVFYVQVLEAGKRIAGVPDAAVEHHFDPARLTSERLRRLARGYGRCDAFLFHHWLHSELSHQRARLAWHVAQLRWRTLTHRRNPFDETTLRLEREVAFHREMLRLRGTPRRYAYRGLRLLDPAAAQA